MPDRQRISSGSPYEPVIGFSRAIRAGDRVLVSGTAPIWPDGSCDPDPGRQAERCIEIIGEALREAGASLEDVVRTRTYLVARADAEAVGAAHGHAFGAIRPASTMVVVAALLDERWRVEMEAEAVRGPERPDRRSRRFGPWVAGAAPDARRWSGAVAQHGDRLDLDDEARVHQRLHDDARAARPVTREELGADGRHSDPELVVLGPGWLAVVHQE